MMLTTLPNLMRALASITLWHPQNSQPAPTHLLQDFVLGKAQPAGDA
jgi:hypothetical protein